MDGWPPSLPEFIKLATGFDFDYDASFDRFINQERLTDVEYFAARDVGYQCRTQLSEPAARKKWRESVTKYQRHAEAGVLPKRGQKSISGPSEKQSPKWLGPDNKMYSCPAEYYAQKINKA